MSQSKNQLGTSDKLRSYHGVNNGLLPRPPDQF